MNSYRLKLIFNDVYSHNLKFGESANLKVVVSISLLTTTSTQFDGFVSS